MINHEVSQRNALPYLIALGLIMLAFLLGWMANEVLQTAGLQVNIGSSSARIDSAPFTEIHPADRKLVNTIYSAPGSASARIDSTSSTEIHPADRKFFKTIYTAVGSAPAGIESTTETDKTDR